MNAIGFSELWLVLLSLLGTPPVGVTLPNQPEPDPAADAARFQAVTGQLDPGGVVHAYVSVDGDLKGIAGYVNSMMGELRKVEPGVPEVNVPALLRVTGLDAVSAMGFSSVRTKDGFRNKTYIHTPDGRRGLLQLMGGDSKPFEVLNLAPAGSDFVIEQDLNFKTLYKSVLEGAGVVMGEQGKAMVQMGLNQPMPPPITFTMEKVMADLDTKLTVIIDADPTKMVHFPDAPKELKIPQLKGAVLLDGLGWVADELTKVLAPMLVQGGNRAPPFKIVRNANWVGIQLAIESENFSEREKKEITELGWETALLAHHLPSGKLVLASGKNFADQLFAPKTSLGQDPAFQKTMKDLPEKGTALTYASPAFFSSLRQFSEKANQLSNDKEHEQDDRFIVSAFIEILLPKNARGEGTVTTNTKDGILTVSNSAHSHKTSLITGLASPFFGVAAFTVGQALEARDQAIGGFEEPHLEDFQRHIHEHGKPKVRRTEDFEKIGD
ncbi:MAG: hypothetical protein HN531_13125 [Opitutae bacterium]|nr:hypothetical protein [Opitutae bacterium]